MNNPPETASSSRAFELAQLWLHQSHDQAVVVLDTSGVIIGWLGGAARVLGFTADEAVGKHIALIFTPDDRRKGYPDHELKLAADDQYSEDSRWHVRKDGARIWASGTVTAVRDRSRTILGFIKLFRDMTDEREHTELFQRQVTQLGDARDKTHRFLKTLGHEIRNPLSVLSNLEVILGRLVEDERAKRAVQQLGAQVAVLKRLADDLMDVTRLELGKLELSTRRTDLRELLHGSVASMQDAAAQKSIKLEALLPPSALCVDADPSRMRQVMLNLLSNAVKYTHVGGSVWVSATQEGNEVVCRVKDTGIGIYPPVLPQIFDLFTQASEGEDMRGGGIGVGLALVRQIVELHGGSVQAKSPGLGKGSEFAIRLPAVMPDARTAENSAEG